MVLYEKTIVKREAQYKLDPHAVRTLLHRTQELQMLHVHAPVNFHELARVVQKHFLARVVRNTIKKKKLCLIFTPLLPFRYFMLRHFPRHPLGHWQVCSSVDLGVVKVFKVSPKSFWFTVYTQQNIMSTPKKKKLQNLYHIAEREKERVLS